MRWGNFEVKTYRVFGPKILGSRHSYSDDALESRIISIRMKETKADHIPLNLEVGEFEKDSEEIRAKLLSWSFDNYYKIDTRIYEKYIDPSIPRRLNEMNSPLICIRHWDKDFVKGLIARSKERHLSLMEDKSLSLEASIVKSISTLYNRKNEDPLLKDISEDLTHSSVWFHTNPHKHWLCRLYDPKNGPLQPFLKIKQNSRLYSHENSRA